MGQLGQINVECHWKKYGELGKYFAFCVDFDFDASTLFLRFLAYRKCGCPKYATHNGPTSGFPYNNKASTHRVDIPYT
jgi:hypothetical protein